MDEVELVKIKSLKDLMELKRFMYYNSLDPIL